MLKVIGFILFASLGFISIPFQLCAQENYDPTKDKALQYYIKRLKDSKGDTVLLKQLTKTALDFVEKQPEKAIEYAQHILTASELALAKSDKNKGVRVNKRSLQHIMVDANNTIGSSYLNQSNYPKSLSYFFKALRISDELNDKAGLGQCYINIGYAYTKQAKYSDALSYLFKAIIIQEKIGNPEGLATAYNNIGLVKWRQSNFPEALSYFFKALKLFEKSGNKAKIGKCYNNIGLINRNQGNFAEALKYYAKSLKVAEELGNKIEIGNAYNNIGNVYILQHNYPEALKNAEKALQIREIIGHKEGIGSCYINIGTIYLEQNKKDIALNYFYKALTLFSDIGDDSGVLFSYSAIGDVLMKKNDLLPALAYFNKSLELSKKTGSREEEKNSCLNISKVYSQLNNYKKAFEFHQLYSNINDSLFNKEKSKVIAEMAAKYDTEKKQREIELLNKDKELKESVLAKKEANIQKQTIQRNALIFGLCLVIFLLVFIYRSYQSKQKANALLKEKNASIYKQKAIIEVKNKELEKLSIVASETGNGVFITDADGNVEWFNDGFSKIFGWASIEEYKKERGSNIRDVSGHKQVEEFIAESVREKKSVTYEAINVTKDGKELWVQATLTPIFDDKGNLSKLVFVDADVSELKKAKETAEEALHIQEQFLANTSHEIRTPMNGIIGMTRQLGETMLTAEQIDYVNAIKESSSSLLHVVNDILDISKMRAGKLELEKTEFRLPDLFKTLLFSLQYNAEKKGIMINITVSHDIPPVLLGDPIRLNQVLLNLAGNAIKFTEKGSVTISANLLKEENEIAIVEFRIIDTGIGIPENKSRLIFESFAQAESHTTRKYGGTGLGLTIAKQLVEQQGGKISVKSKEGQGSTFSFSLLFAIGNPQWQGNVAQQIMSGIPANADLSNVNVLVVEDNKINQRVAALDLRKWKTNVDFADDAESAIEKLKSKHYDLVLMDISMPGMDGLQATRYIRSKMPSPVSAIPIIAMTASALVGEREKCFEAGMNDYISKPFNPVDLFNKTVKWSKSKIPTVAIASDIIVPATKKQSGKLINLNILREHASGDIDYIKEMLDIYIHDMPSYVADLKSCLEQNDWEGVKKHAHKMKSPLALFNANEVKDMLAEIEENVKYKIKMEALPDLVQRSITLCLKTVEEVKIEREKINS